MRIFAGQEGFQEIPKMRKWSRNPPQMMTLRLQIREFSLLTPGLWEVPVTLRGPLDHHAMTRRAKALGVTLPVPASLAKMCLRPKRSLDFEKVFF